MELSVLDLVRLHDEIFHSCEGDFETWADKNGIPADPIREMGQGLTEDVFARLMGDVSEKIEEEGGMAENEMMAVRIPHNDIRSLIYGAVQTAYIIGWECHKQLAPREEDVQLPETT